MKIKNWQKYQHYKNRRPPWIRLYRDLLDDPEFHVLPGEAVKVLIQFWLIASEDGSQEGLLPSLEKLCFRLRIGEADLLGNIEKLTDWLVGASDLIAERSQRATPERSVSVSVSGSSKYDRSERGILSSDKDKDKDKDKDTNIKVVKDKDKDFEIFWKAYPRKKNKGAALKAWRKLKKSLPPLEKLIAIIEEQKKSTDWTKDAGQFIPYPATWLNASGWEDEITEPDEWDLRGYQ